MRKIAGRGRVSPRRHAAPLSEPSAIETRQASKMGNRKERRKLYLAIRHGCVEFGIRARRSNYRPNPASCQVGAGIPRKLPYLDAGGLTMVFRCGWPYAANAESSSTLSVLLSAILLVYTIADRERDGKGRVHTLAVKYFAARQAEEGGRSLPCGLQHEIAYPGRVGDDHIGILRADIDGVMEDPGWNRQGISGFQNHLPVAEGVFEPSPQEIERLFTAKMGMARVGLALPDDDSTESQAVRVSDLLVG